MKLPRRRFLNVAVGAAAIPATSGVAKAEVYPSRTITMIVPIAPGLGTDALARILAEHMRGTLGQSRHYRRGRHHWYCSRGARRARWLHAQCW